MNYVCVSELIDHFHKYHNALHINYFEFYLILVIVPSFYNFSIDFIRMKLKLCAYSDALWYLC